VWWDVMDRQSKQVKVDQGINKASAMPLLHNTPPPTHKHTYLFRMLSFV
jgi:hypothetical protein